MLCPHTSMDNCDCRKPKIALGMEAIRKFGCNKENSIMIGDQETDIEFGQRLGFRTVKLSKKKDNSRADLVCENWQIIFESIVGLKELK